MPAVSEVVRAQRCVHLYAAFCAALRNYLEAENIVASFRSAVLAESALSAVCALLDGPRGVGSQRFQELGVGVSLQRVS